MCVCFRLGWASNTASAEADQTRERALVPPRLWCVSPHALTYTSGGDLHCTRISAFGTIFHTFYPMAQATTI